MSHAQILPRMSRTLPLTDDQGKMIWNDVAEPHPGSVVLTNGIHGTAYQRLFKDGLWHSAVSPVGFTWEDMLGERNLMLAYDAPERVTGAKR